MCTALSSPRDVLFLEALENYPRLVARTMAEGELFNTRQQWQKIGEQKVKTDVIVCHSNGRLMDEAFPLTKRLGTVHPAFGRRCGFLSWSLPVVWNRGNPMDGELGSRGPRKQIAARLARRIESMDAREVAIVERVFSVGPDNELDVSRKIVGWERNKLDHPINQGFRKTNFEEGFKYAGGHREIVRVARTQAESIRIERPGAGRPSDLEKKIRKMFGL